MKTLYFLFSLLITTQLISKELAWVDEQIEAIKPARIGVSEKEISKIKDPFIFLHKNNNSKLSKIKKELSSTSHSVYKKSIKHQIIHFNLEAILNKSAMINGQWYKEGSYIHGYKIAKVNRQSVLLMRKNKKLLLSTLSRSNKIKINNK
ncbi:hypothetical protein [Sulfurimonas sp.]